MKLHHLLACTLVMLVMYPAWAQTGKADSGLFLHPITQTSSLQLPERAITKMQALEATNRYKSLTTYRVGSMAATATSGVLRLQLPSGKKLKARTTRLDYRNEQHYTYHGQLPREGQVMLMAREGEAMGQIRYNGAVYTIQQLPEGGTVVLEQDAEALKSSTCATPESETTTILPAPPATDKQDAAALIAPPDAEIRVLALYTPAARASVASISNLIDVANAQLNDGLGNSGIFGNQITFTVVGKRELVFNELPNIGDDVDTLVNLLAANSLREQYEADIVVLLTNGDYGSAAGVAADIGPDSEKAYAIVQTEYATSTYTYAHEVGHLMGCRHQQCSVYFTGGCDDTAGEAHGWRWTYRNWFLGKLYRKHTVMHNLVYEHDRELKFSTPLVEDNDEKIGRADLNDNVRILRATAPTVANFRQSAPAVYISVGGPASAADGEAIALAASVSGGTAPFSFEWQTSTDNITYTTVPGSGATVFTTMPIGSGLYYKATVTDSQGQQATSAYNYITNTGSGDGDGGPCPECPDYLPGQRMTKPALADGMQVYPIPASDEVHVQYSLPEAGPVHLRLTDGLGRTVYTTNQTATAGDHRLTAPLTGVAAGVYFVILHTPQRVQTYRLIKE